MCRGICISLEKPGTSSNGKTPLWWKNPCTSYTMLWTAISSMVKLGKRTESGHWGKDMPFSASPEPEGDWQSTSPCSGQYHWGMPFTSESWITSEDQAFIKDAEQMLKIIKDSFLGIKSMHSTLLSSSYFLCSLWYPSAVSLYTFRHMFWLHEHHCTFPISCSGPGCLSF